MVLVISQLNYSAVAQTFVSISLAVAISNAAPRSIGQNPGSVDQSGCRLIGEVVRVRDLPEASGIAASHRTPGVFWAHNDSGQPRLFALNAQGSVTGRLRVEGASVDDWEDISVARCPQGSCIYIGDIGDNSGKRDRITVYRVPEPAPGDASTLPAEVFHATYPDGAHDAEALFVTANSDVFIITKGDPGPIALYRFPRPLRSGETMRLERIGEPATGSKVSATDRPTSADVSNDGQWVAVRTTDSVAFYRAGDLTAGRWREAFRSDVTNLARLRCTGLDRP
jgi:hypothetical protein